MKCNIRIRVRISELPRDQNSVVQNPRNKVKLEAITRKLSGHENIDV